MNFRKLFPKRSPNTNAPEMGGVKGQCAASTQSQRSGLNRRPLSFVDAATCWILRKSNDLAPLCASGRPPKTRRYARESVPEAFLRSPDFLPWTLAVTVWRYL